MDSISFHRSLTKELFQHYQDEHLASQYAWWILEAITGNNKASLLAKNSLLLTEKQQKELTDWKYKLTHEHMPLQYLIGTVPFDGVSIIVEPPVLIPRPETEAWCMHLITQLQSITTFELMVLDLATGSGCIALALGYNMPKSIIHATDISQGALSLAKRNAKMNNVTNVQFFFSDLFSNVTDTYDIVVSNPPYISEDEFKKLDKSVIQWEDKKALVAADNGLQIIKNIIINAPHYIRKNNEMYKARIPQLIIEIGYQQGEIVKHLFHKQGYNNVAIYKDIEGKDRYVAGRIDEIMEKKI